MCMSPLRVALFLDFCNIANTFLMLKFGQVELIVLHKWCPLPFSRRVVQVVEGHDFVRS